jgi:hypothetical protein
MRLRCVIWARAGKAATFVTSYDQPATGQWPVQVGAGSSQSDLVRLRYAWLYDDEDIWNVVVDDWQEPGG